MKLINLQKHRRGTKAVSAVITTIILTGILLVILVVASFVSLSILSVQVSNTEFEQAKSNMLLLDDTVQDVALRSGSGGYVQFNEQNGGIGISKTTESILIKANPGKTFLTAKPIAAGYYSQWTVFPNGDRVIAVSDGKDDTYLTAASVNKTETQKLEGVIPRTSAINQVTINLRAWATENKNNNQLQIIARINGHNYYSVDNWVKKTAINFTLPYTLNPVTGKQWEWSDLSNLEVGCNITKFEGGEFRVSELSVTIDFTPPATTTNIMNGSFDLYEFVYSAGTQTSASPMEMRGTDFCTVSITDNLGYLRVEQDNGAKIKLDYNRVRVANQTLVDPYTNMVQITFIKLVKGDWGGAGSIHLKIQNIDVDSTPHVIPSGNVTLSIQMGSSQTTMFLNKYATEPDVLSTVIIFSEITIEATT